MREKEFVDISGLMGAQRLFENEIKGTDGTLWDKNTPEHIVERGLIGEAQEFLDDIRAGNMEHAKIEAVDILIFLSSLFNHLEMTPEEVSTLAELKMTMNWYKYSPDKFRGVELDEGIRRARENHAYLRQQVTDSL